VSLVTGFRLTISASLLVSITSEMLLSTNGIGAFVQRSQESLHVPSGLAGIVAIAIVGHSSTPASAVSRSACCSGTIAPASRKSDTEIGASG
jgi:ABC-type nitrate/sulfonate/bicarbonate transport system permease component